MNNTNPFKLDRVGRKIAIISLIIGILFIIGGIAYEEDGLGGYSNDGYQTPDTGDSLSMNSTEYYYPGSDTYTDFNIYCSSYQTYYIYITGGTLNSLQNNYGNNVNYSLESNNGDEMVYSFYTNDYGTYYFEVYSNDYSISVRVSDYY